MNNSITNSMKFSDNTPHDVLQAAVKEHVGAKADADIRTLDDLSFTSRDEIGRRRWFDVVPYPTNYWHFHEKVGRNYAHQLLALIRNSGTAEEPEPGEGLSHRTFGFIASGIVRELKGPEGIYDGFFAAISEALHQAMITDSKKG